MRITPIVPVAALITAIAPSLALPSLILIPERLSNNVFLLGAVPWKQKTRAELIAKAEYIKHHDVVVLQECFRNEFCEDLKQSLRSVYPHATPSIGDSKAGWLSTSGKFNKLSPENGGVAILTAQIRAQALDDFYYFVLAQQIPESELVVMVGDFNIDRDSFEYREVLRRLRVVRSTFFKGAQWSYDTKQNGIARDRDPTAPSQNLDHILVSTQHRMPRSVVETTLLVHSTPYTHGSGTFNEFSDHYPVHAVIDL
ncbi:hypothetical protein BGZ67_006214 [Mortierella alpina]|nr:hypothetical protein BGZ67_006214 [Mortierella alpina]